MPEDSQGKRITGVVHNELQKLLVYCVKGFLEPHYSLKTELTLQAGLCDGSNDARNFGGD